MSDILIPQRLEPERSETNDMFVHAFARGLHVIRSFGEGSEKQTLSDVARRSNISRASARRLLHTLLQLGYVDHDGKHFWLKPRILDLGYSFISSMDFAGVAQEAINELAEKMGSSASLAALDGHDLIYIVRSTTRNGSHCKHVIGDRQPAYVMSIGRVLLAELDDAELDRYLKTATFTRYTPYTITDPQELRKIIRADGKKGWSIVRREMNEGVCAVGMPIRSKGGTVVAALGLSIRPDLSTDPETIDNALRELSSTIETINGLIRLRA